MKLIYLSHWRFPSDKTHTAFALKTCAGFLREGLEVELWIPNRRNPDLPSPRLRQTSDDEQYIFQHSGITERFPVRKLWCLDLMQELGTVGFVLMVATFSFSVFLALLKEKGAVVYAHDMRDTILPALLPRPLFIEIHDFYESSWRGLNRFVLKRADGLIVTNQLKIDHMAETYKYPRENMLMQQNAVDADFFDSKLNRQEAREKLGLPLEKKIALYAGHLYTWKGVKTLARAAQYLPENTLIYFVGGTENDRVRLQKIVVDEKLPRVEFISHQPQERVPLYLRAADVLVLPNTGKVAASRVETSPVKLFEYLASGTPVVASDLPSVREIVSEREVQFAAADDPKRFAEAIAAALADPQAGERSRRGQELAHSHSWEERARRIHSFIRQRLSVDVAKNS